MGDQILISFVVPVFNEDSMIEMFVQQVREHISPSQVRYEIIFINDGSVDNTLKILHRLRQSDRRIKIIDLSRNFGKEAAMTAGLDFAKGDAIIIMDVDLQDPPEILPQMIAQWRSGYSIVNARRRSREADTFLKRATASFFYKLFNRMSDAKIPANVGDFRLMDRKVVDAIKQLPERVRFMKGLFAWVGFQSTTVEFERGERQAGSSKFNYWRLWNFALDGITSFSTVPLRMWTYFGLAIASLSFVYSVFIIARTLILGNDLPGYASTLTAVLFFGGIQLIGLGIIGEYLGRVYVEVKRRPAYIIASIPEETADGHHSNTEVS